MANRPTINSQSTRDGETVLWRIDYVANQPKADDYRSLPNGARSGVAIAASINDNGGLGHITCFVETLVGLSDLLTYV